MTDTDAQTTHIAIIGGGLTGLITAALLERHWTLPLSITIFEKSRGVGRMATRYRKASNDSDNKQWQWAMGVQSFSAKSDDFKNFITPFIDSGTLVPWHSRMAHVESEQDKAEQVVADVDNEANAPKHPRYISSPKMTGWGRAIADGLTQTDIQFKTRIAPLADSAVHNNEARSTELYDDLGNRVGVFDCVICTAPNVQAAELFAATSFAAKEAILTPTMQACYTLMLGWQDNASLPAVLSEQARRWSVLSVADGVLDKIFVEQDKPEHGHLLPSITIHADNAWSEAHVDDDQDAVRARLLEAAQQVLGWDTDTIPDHVDLHRWRYAATTGERPNEVPLIDKDKRWLVTGDWCGAGSIESCYDAAAASVTAVICAS